MSSLYLVIFNKLAPRIIDEAIDTIKIIEDWYICELFTFIRVLGNNSLHPLPKFVLGRLVLR